MEQKWDTFEDPPRHKGADTIGSDDQVIASGEGTVHTSAACPATLDGLSCTPIVDWHYEYGWDKEPPEGLDRFRWPQYNAGYGNVVIIEYSYDSLPQDVIDRTNLGADQSLYVLYGHLQAPSSLPSGPDAKVRLGLWAQLEAQTGSIFTSRRELVYRILCHSAPLSKKIGGENGSTQNSRENGLI